MNQQKMQQHRKNFRERGKNLDLIVTREQTQKKS